MALEHRFLQLLELPTSVSTSKIFLTLKIHDKLFPGGGIHGVVRPDLPEVHPLFRINSARAAMGQNKPSSVGRTVSASSPPVASLDSMEQLQNKIQQSGCWQVQTVAAQLRSRKEISRRLVTSAELVHRFGCGGSLLLVSGGHPLRRLPLVESLISGTSFDMLQTASQLRKDGDIPAGVQIWAVENPLSNPVERLEKKIHAGAEALILQPPLLLDRFDEWWDAARTRGCIPV